MPSNLKGHFTLTDHPYATRSKSKTTRSKHKNPLQTPKQPSKTTTLDASPETSHHHYRSNQTTILHPDLTLDGFFPKLFDTNGDLSSNEVQNYDAEMSSLEPLEDPSKTNSETDSLLETFFSN